MGYKKNMVPDASTEPVGPPRPSFASSARPPRPTRIGSGDWDDHLHMSASRNLPGKSSQAPQPSDHPLGRRAVPQPRKPSRGY